MKKSILIFALMLTSVFYGQKLIYKSGAIYDENNQKLSNSQINAIFSANYIALESYEAGKTKGTVGGFLLGFGIGFALTDLGYALFSDKKYPTAYTYVGIASTLISIPVLIGRHTKVKNAVNVYNENISDKKTSFNFEKINIISTQSGVGLAVTF